MSFNRLFAPILLSIALLFSVASTASAATLNVVGGELFGASDVLVDGNLYNVEFLDGACSALYNGCDSESDFTFPTLAAATLAAQALLDQVFTNDVLGAFDDTPRLTNGCGLTRLCRAITPHALGPLSIGHVEALNYNLSSGSLDTLRALGSASGYDTASNLQQVFAVWQPVPEPSTALLIALGLAGLGFRGRAKHA